MEKFIEIEKRSKKERKAFYAKQRGVNGFNTGTRTMQTEKNPSRAKRKAKMKKMLDTIEDV